MNVAVQSPVSVGATNQTSYVDRRTTREFTLFFIFIFIFFIIINVRINFRTSQLLEVNNHTNL